MATGYNFIHGTIVLVVHVNRQITGYFILNSRCAIISNDIKKTDFLGTDIYLNGEDIIVYMYIYILLLRLQSSVDTRFCTYDIDLH